MSEITMPKTDITTIRTIRGVACPAPFGGDCDLS
jgi:hypothetical protein